MVRGSNPCAATIPFSYGFTSTGGLCTGGATPVNYMALKAAAGSADLVGIAGLTAGIRNLSVVVNKTSSTTAPAANSSQCSEVAATTGQMIRSGHQGPRRRRA